MRAPIRACSSSRIPAIANFTLLVAILARDCSAILPAPPSTDDKWLYPDVNTSPTYNYLDVVNASWTSNFVAPHLLLRCQHPNDATHYAYRTSSPPPPSSPSTSNATLQHTTNPSQPQVRPSCPSTMETPWYATSKSPTSAPPAHPHPRSSATISTS